MPILTVFYESSKHLFIGTYLWIFLLYLHIVLYYFSIENQSSNKTSFLPTQGETGMAVLSTKTKVLGKKLREGGDIALCITLVPKVLM